MTTLEAVCRWQLGSAPSNALTRDLPDVHEVVRQVLARRGYDTADRARSFLARTPGDDDPFRLTGVAEAVARLQAAIAEGEHVTVYGDFDADGVTATAVLVETIASLGGNVTPFIPHRERDGYGLSESALGKLADEGVALVVTVDCGIRAAPEIAYASSRGLDVIVTDHHAVPEKLPDAVAVINPLQPDCDYGFTGLSGVGLAFKLAQAMLRSTTLDSAARTLAESRLLDLVAIGTVADVVPLLGENRSLVQRGVEQLRATGRAGLKALLQAANYDPHDLSSRDLAYVVGPRINAAGRMDNAATALELLLESDPAAATRLAAELERINTDRRAATEAAQDAAEAALRGHTDKSMLVFADSGLSLGVIGLVAGRLARDYYRPAAVVRIDGELARGSARSIPEFDVVAALEDTADLLVRFGGHARAAGFTVETRNLDELTERLAQAADTALRDVDMRPTLHIDATVSASDIGWGLYEAMSQLEPFGEGNRRPHLLISDARLSSQRKVGGKHLRFVVEGGTDAGSIDAIAFNAGDRIAALGNSADLVCSLRVNKWRGRRNLELLIEDMAAPS